MWAPKLALRVSCTVGRHRLRRARFQCSPYCGHRLVERLADRIDRGHCKRAHDHRKGGKLNEPALEPAGLVSFGGCPWRPPPFDETSRAVLAHRRDAMSVVDERLNEDRVLRTQSGTMALVPGDSSDDGVAPATDLDIGASRKRFGALNPKAVQRHIENAHVMPAQFAAHARLDHDLLPVFASFHGNAFTQLLPTAGDFLVDLSHPGWSAGLSIAPGRIGIDCSWMLICIVVKSFGSWWLHGHEEQLSLGGHVTEALNAMRSKKFTVFVFKTDQALPSDARLPRNLPGQMCLLNQRYVRQPHPTSNDGDETQSTGQLDH